MGWLKVSTVTSLVLAAILPASGSAQSSGNQPAPPTSYNIDGNGVDVVSGKFYFPTNDVYIGGGQDSGLAYNRVTRDFGYDDDYMSLLNVAGGLVDVSIGALTDRLSTTTSESVLGTGGRLGTSGSNYSYSTADSVSYYFNAAYKSERFRVAQQRLEQIIFPTGRNVMLTYDTVTICFSATPCGTGNPAQQISRVATIASNDGYRLVLRYRKPSFSSTTATPEEGSDWMSVASVVASNAGTEYCDASNCLPGGNWPSVRYSWNATLNQETRKDSEGRDTVITYDGNDQIVGVQRSTGSTAPASLTYAAGKVATYTIGASTWHYSYATFGTNEQTTTITSPTGLVRTIVSNPVTMKILSDRTGTGPRTTYEYYPDTQLKKVVQPEGNAIEYVYDTRARLTSVTRTPRSGTGSIVTSATYPSDCTAIFARCNKPLTTTDARGKVTNYTYTDSGDIATITYPAATSSAVRPQTRYSYQFAPAWFKNSSGVIVVAADGIRRPTGTSRCITGAGTDSTHPVASCHGTADEVRTVIRYDGGGPTIATNLLPVLLETRSGNDSGPGAVASFQILGYDTVSNVVQVDGPLLGVPDVTTYRYNRNRELVGTISPVPGGSGLDGQPLRRRAVRITRDPVRGLVTEVAAGTVNGVTDADWAAFASLQHVETGYDPATYLKTLERAYGTGTTPLSLTQYSYDLDLRGKCTAARVDPSIPPASNVCAQGSTADGYDQIAETEYDPAGRIGATKENGTATATYGYDDGTVSAPHNGVLASVTDANGNVSTYGYDGYDRRTSVTYPGGSSDSVTLDAADNVHTETRRGGGGVTNNYDDLNRLIERAPTGASTHVASYAYDLLGRLTSALGTGSGAWQNSAVYDYDALSRLTTATAYGTGGAHVLGMRYDTAGRRTRLTWGSPGAWGDGLYVDYDYLLTGEVSAIREDGATTGAGELARYTYDNLGQRRVLIRGNGVRTDWTPDGISRLKVLQYQATGGWASQTVNLGYNGVSQLRTRTASNDNFAYPGYSPMVQTVVPNPLNQMGTLDGVAPAYDSRGNLTNDARGNAYAYNIDNQLVGKTGGPNLAYDTAGRLATIAGAATVRFDYDGQDLIAESDASGMLTRRYVHGPGVDEPLVWYEGAGTGDRRWLGSDERGSITAVTNAGGEALKINAYDENGVPAQRNIGRFGYTGQAWLSEVGLAYYKARTYDPTIARFLQSDPIGYDGGINLYAYVRGDPINHLDPMGLACAAIPAGEVNIATVCAPRQIITPGPVFAKPSVGLPAPSLARRRDTRGAPQRRQSPCERALAQPGKIEYGGNTGSLILLGGLSVSWGQWRNLQTGSFGRYKTVGAGLGLGLGVTRDYGHARSLADFVGYGETASAGGSIGPIGGGYSWTQNVAGDVVSRGGSLGYSPPSPSVGYGNVGVSATATAGDTAISGCQVHGQ